MLYIANISKTMQVILVEGRNNVTFAAPWSPDGQATPTLQNVMFMLPKGRWVLGGVGGAARRKVCACRGGALGAAFYEGVGSA